MQALHAGVEPSFEPGPALPLGQKEDTEPNLPENDRIHDDLTLGAHFGYDARDWDELQISSLFATASDWEDIRELALPRAQ